MAWIAGLDEVGMGPLAGPLLVVVAAFDSKKEPLEGLDDSKALSKKKRMALFDPIVQYCDFLGFGHADAQEIDRLGMVEAWQLAAGKALARHPDFESLLVDGSQAVRQYRGRQETVVKGDSLHWQISAASIVAKVLRDADMLVLHQTLPQYGWDRNVGYGTAQHYRALHEFGPSLHHRKSFLKNMRGEHEKKNARQDEGHGGRQTPGREPGLGSG